MTLPRLPDEPRRESLAMRRVVDVLRLVWLLLLILPAASVTSATEPWDIDSRTLFALSCWLVVGARLVLPARWFFPASLPVLLLGVVCMGADFLRHVNLLDLALQWHTFSLAEVAATMGPYAVPIGVAAIALLPMCWICARAPETRRYVRWILAGFVAITAVLALVLPRVAWVRAWPLDAALVTLSAVTDSRSLLATPQPALSSVDPRDPRASWHARPTSTAARQTVVFIVGESVRADYLPECHGPERVRSAGEDALVACDVTSGSDATHTSVPLLVSREMPGHSLRVSTDATFQHALSEAGFETHWIGDQGNSLAWPDARFQAYPDAGHSDVVALMQPLAAALSRPAPRKAIVLHAYNAHDPYCYRFDPASAPYLVDCVRLNTAPDASLAAPRRLSHLLDAEVPVRDRVVQQALGSTVKWSVLEAEAR
jgi:glucan phosphoethanolaminetransferase (alkaline phosphatase superfamily)